MEDPRKRVFLFSPKFSKIHPQIVLTNTTKEKDMKKAFLCNWNFIVKDGIYLLFIYGCIHLEIPLTQKEHSHCSSFLTEGTEHTYCFIIKTKDKERIAIALDTDRSCVLQTL